LTLILCDWNIKSHMSILINQLMHR
jgi:hypothetical protein